VLNQQFIQRKVFEIKLVFDVAAAVASSSPRMFPYIYV
jgi:hypothetical protein